MALDSLSEAKAGSPHKQGHKMIKTIDVSVKFLDPRHRPSKEDLIAFLNGDCAACGNKESVGLQTSDEFTNFYLCHECSLAVHCEVIEIITGEKVPNSMDAMNGLITMLSTDNPGRQQLFGDLEKIVKESDAKRDPQ